VFVNDKKEDKPGVKVDVDSIITIKENVHPYVSRGGLKLEKAIRVFNIDLKDKTAIDVGASTGGFTDCMLKNGAKKVFAVDVGYGQLAWELRNDDGLFAWKEQYKICKTGRYWYSCGLFVDRCFFYIAEKGYSCCNQPAEGRR